MRRRRAGQACPAPTQFPSRLPSLAARRLLTIDESLRWPDNGHSVNTDGERARAKLQITHAPKHVMHQTTKVKSNTLLVCFVPRETDSASDIKPSADKPFRKLGL